MSISNTFKTAALSIAVMFSTSAMAGTQATTSATATAQQEQIAASSAESNVKPRPKYKNTKNGRIFSNTKKVKCHAAWGNKYNKHLTGKSRTKSPNFPGS